MRISAFSVKKSFGTKKQKYLKTSDSENQRNKDKNKPGKCNHCKNWVIGNATALFKRKRKKIKIKNRHTQQEKH